MVVDLSESSWLVLPPQVFWEFVNQATNLVIVKLLIQKTWKDFVLDVAP